MPISNCQPIRLLDPGCYKQCRSRSVGFFSQLIWIYSVCNGRIYLGSAGQGLMMFCIVFLRQQHVQLRSSRYGPFFFNQTVSFFFNSIKTYCKTFIFGSHILGYVIYRGCFFFLFQKLKICQNIYKYAKRSTHNNRQNLLLPNLSVLQ